VDIIAAPDEKVKALFIIVWGKIKMFRIFPDGHEQTIYIFGAGEPFCITALEDGTFPASASALEDTRVLMLPSDVMESVAKSEPSLIFNLMTVLIRRLKESMSIIEMLSMKEIPQRLASWLLHSHVLQGDSESFSIGMSHRELSKLLGTTPETLSRSFRRFQDEGAIELDGRDVRITDLPRLKGIASGDI
jgi:CRP/FNR family transcriptional regulator